MDEEQDQISSAVQAIMDARPAFRVGDRVRVTAGVSECRQDWQQGTGEFGHWDEWIGATGTVKRIVRRAADNHPILVLLDRRVVQGRYALEGLYLNACELEHLNGS